MASIANWVIILVIITSITFIRLSIIIIALIINIIFFTFPHKENLCQRSRENLVIYKNGVWGVNVAVTLHLLWTKPCQTSAPAHWIRPLVVSKWERSEEWEVRFYTHWLTTKKKGKKEAATQLHCSQFHTSSNWGAADQWPQITKCSRLASAP